MPEFRYFKLYNQSTPEKDVNIFPYIKASNGSVIYDGSVTNPDIFVKPNDSFTFDFHGLVGPASGTIVMLGACQKNTSQTANDTANTWTYKSDSLHTVYGHYYGEGNFVVEIPNSSTADAAALPDNYHSINTPAVAKLLVALGGVLSPQMT